MLSIITNNATSSFENQTFKDFELVADNPNGEFVLTIDQEVEFKSNYLELLLKTFKKNPSLGMVYSNGVYSNKPILRRMDSKYMVKQPHRNFIKIIYNGASIPTNFGIFRREVWGQLQPDRNFDSFQAETNDFRLAKFFLYGNKLSFVNTPLFKIKEINCDLLNHTNTINNIINWTTHISKQLEFYTEICKIIDVTSKKSKLKLLAIDSCLNRIIPILAMILQEVPYDAFEYSIIRRIVLNLIPINTMRIKNVNGRITKIDIENIQVRLKILNEKILGFIKEIVQDEATIDEAIEKVRVIQFSFQ